MAMSVAIAATELTGNDALAQSLELYFRTPKGSIPLHPELGFGIFDYVDRNVSTILKLIREVRTGIALWDSRITILTATPVFGIGSLKMSVKWSPNNDASNIITQQIPL